MEIRQISYFLEVAQQGSFTKASQTLHISQPALSKTIKAFETELGVELLDRTDKRVRLTDSGEIVYQYGKQILNTISTLTSSLEDNAMLKSGHIKMGLPSLIGIMFFPNIMKGFASAYPGITVALTEEGTNNVIHLVDKGDLDCGIVMLPVDQNDFDVIPLTQDRLMLFLHKSHVLANHSEISMMDVKDEPMILFTEDFTMHDRIIQECNDFGFQPHIAYKSSQWDFIKDMVENNLGITFFPGSLNRKINKEKIISLPITDPYIPWKVGIIVKKGSHRSFATQALVDYILDSDL
ncbi:LysR family transcriptional regulator [Staphylococcus nepalensis]|uniref:LysR family transcriptional regulator n=1 Tax=Staphylococcus nepalensis TaxID=214473 RepID=A0A380GJR9_9STAP|nr:LysR family transcriptional regulator [Staphylococcus nepalensis]VDG65829.1 transcriptional regulator, LysR family [Lacrimispora indolis]MBO1222307.1 LysR family transcriptional regulator [Staphylococcus nepalensis]PNZ97399.1 LysR family transcriptional regulator [Staphylococcus nepalensis]SUM53900.1 LysR family transcriptional regulator [Staphylococcus nepalensis]GGB89592.1 putative HTH-type transcriptional regulator YwbI [Staphylococcus nepalensis]